MMTVNRTTTQRVLALAFAAGMVACGEVPHVQQAAAAPLTESTVSFRQTGNAAVSIAGGSVTYRLDDAHLLVVTLTVHSTAGASQTVTVRGSFDDKAGKLVGDATGSQLDVAPGSTVTVTLSGPTPTGTIAAGTFELTTIPSATPLGS